MVKINTSLWLEKDNIVLPDGNCVRLYPMDKPRTQRLFSDLLTEDESSDVSGEEGRGVLGGLPARLTSPL